MTLVSIRITNYYFNFTGFTKCVCLWLLHLPYFYIFPSRPTKRFLGFGSTESAELIKNTF